jgi:hypothetical protein
MRASRLQELQEMAAQLFATARKLPPGPDRRNILQEIGGFRVQIAALQGADLRPAQLGAEGEGKIIGRDAQPIPQASLLRKPRLESFATL